jgi:hypothetical protein
MQSFHFLILLRSSFLKIRITAPITPKTPYLHPFSYRVKPLQPSFSLSDVIFLKASKDNKSNSYYDHDDNYGYDDAIKRKEGYAVGHRCFWVKRQMFFTNSVC